MKDLMYDNRKPYCTLDSYFKSGGTQKKTTKDWFMKHISGSLLKSIKIAMQQPVIKSTKDLKQESMQLRKHQFTEYLKTFQFEAQDKEIIQITTPNKTYKKTKVQLGFKKVTDAKAWIIFIDLLTNPPHLFNCNCTGRTLTNQEYYEKYLPLASISRKLITYVCNRESTQSFSRNFTCFQSVKGITGVYQPIFKITRLQQETVSDER